MLKYQKDEIAAGATEVSEVHMFWKRKKENTWPEGIPVYGETDLMHEPDLFELAMRAVRVFTLIPDGYKILAVFSDIDQIPNYVCEKNGEKVFVIVRAGIAPDMPRLSVEEKKAILAHAAKFGFKSFFAPASIGSCDPKRLEAGLMLKNDKYHIKHIELQRIEKKSEEWIRSKIEEIDQLRPHVVFGEGISTYGNVGSSDVMFSVKDDEGYLKSFLEWTAEHKGQRNRTFQQELLKHIETKGMTNQEFYNAALIDRKLFSAIKNNTDYKPKKETAVACCLGLGLGWEEAEELLEVAGYTLSLAIPWDRVVYYCIHEGITDIDVVNELLYAEGEKCIRVQ